MEAKFCKSLMSFLILEISRIPATKLPAWVLISEENGQQLVSLEQIGSPSAALTRRGLPAILRLAADQNSTFAE